MLEGKRVRLRKVTKNDLDKIYLHLEQNLYSNGIDNGFYYDLLPFSQFEKKFLGDGLFTDRQGLILIVDYKEKMLGSIIYEKSRLHDSYNLKYLIFDEKNYRTNLMTEAMLLFSRFLFQFKQTNRLEILIPNYLKPAIKVAEKTGFKFEGVLKEALFFRGSFIDLCLYAKLKKDEPNFS